jgi:type VI secretion system VasD/TssJ family lipoprotein
MKALALLLICLLACSGCGGKAAGPPSAPPPAPAENPGDVAWYTDPKGLRLFINTDSDLNRDSDEALGLTMCVYQLPDTKLFNAQSGTSSGLDKLLDCDIAGVEAVAAKQFKLQPDKKLEVPLARQQGARYLGIVAGYAHLQPQQCAYTVELLLDSAKEGWVPFRTTVYSPARMDVIINLHASAMDIDGVKRE